LLFPGLCFNAYAYALKHATKATRSNYFFLPLPSFVLGGCFTHAGRYKGEMQKGCLLFLYEVFFVGFGIITFSFPFSLLVSQLLLHFVLELKSSKPIP
jgi:hypothetical protein